MNLTILLPHQVFVERDEVISIVAETREGAFGLLPQRLDCVAPLTPGIMIYRTAAEGEIYVAVDEGVLVKTGPAVRVSVRRAIAGPDLRRLRNAVEREFLTLDDQQQNLRTVLAKLEAGFLRRFSSFRHD